MAVSCGNCYAGNCDSQCAECKTVAATDNLRSNPYEVYVAGDLIEWVQERYDNCIRIANQKQGSDKFGWLMDAVHFERILKVLAAVKGKSA